jgi:hypothetical protein
MRVPQLVSDFVEWRWAPCVGLTAGSLTFVALALLLIPTRLGGEPSVVRTLGSFDSARPQREIFCSSLTGKLTEPTARLSDELSVARSLPQPSPQGNETGVAPRRGFSPIIDRPEPPPAPPPAPTAVEPPPAPAAGSVVITQPEPGGPARELTAP